MDSEPETYGGAAMIQMMVEAQLLGHPYRRRRLRLEALFAG
ncbi:hypothetical protein [Streptomyces sp. A1136]|nr:hypothetical protein [Streptomyces sp. A1136]